MDEVLAMVALKWVLKYVFLLAKLNREERPVLKGKIIYLSSKLLTYGGKVNHLKSVDHPLSTLPVGIGNTMAAFKTNP